MATTVPQIMANTKTHLFCLFLLAGVMASCGKNVIYSHYEPLPPSGWEADSALTYCVNITDTLSAYDLILQVRHTQSYPYQNMWLFLETPAGKDTIEFYLADQRGRWLGNGFGDIREMPVLYGHSIRFPRSGEYRYTIRQGMREERLHGVHDIGLMVEKQ